MSGRIDRQRVVFFYNPDRIRIADRIEAGKIRTYRHRTGFFTKFRTESGQQTDTGHDFPENPDKNETRAGHGHTCGQTADSLFRRTLESIQWLWPVSGFCPDSVRNFVKNPVRCLSVRILSVSILSGVRIFKKSSVRFLSVRPDKDKT